VLLPPEGVAPARLFRILSSPQPVEALPAPFSGLHVRAIPSGVVVGAADRGDPTPIILSTAIVDAEGRQALTTDEVLDLPLPDYDALARATLAVLKRISPWRHVIDMTKWNDVLCKGVRELENLHAYHMLGISHDVATFDRVYRFIPRPDRYYGRPLVALLDGQWLAYRAARAVYEENVKANSK